MELYVPVLSAHPSSQSQSSHIPHVTQTDFNNVLTMGLCSFGLVAGVIQRFTHRYKALQIFGICVKIIGYGLLVDKNGVHDVGRLVMSQLLTVSPRLFM